MQPSIFISQLEVPKWNYFMSYVEHIILFQILYSKQQSLLRDIPVFIFSCSKISFISFNSRKEIYSLLYLYIVYPYEIPDQIERSEIKKDIMKFFDWFFPEK